MTAKRLFVDQDGTLARFHDEVYYLERMYEPGFFANLKPFENMVAGIKLFAHQHPDAEVYLLSSKLDSPHCVADKSYWLDLHSVVDADHRIFCDMGSPKTEYIPGGVTANDFLLDDYNKNLNDFLYAGGNAIKCHNNINQKGLGAYGGELGNLWLGSMVHTNNHPELIAAELAQHMGLPFDLKRVADIFPKINLIYDDTKTPSGSFYIRENHNGTYTAHERIGGCPLSHTFLNPFNALRYLDGKEEFFERNIKSFDGQTLCAPEHQLHALSLNLYNDPDFNRYLRADRAQFIDDAKLALDLSKIAVVGQISYLSSDGQTIETAVFRSHEAMQFEIDKCGDREQAIEAEWAIPPPASVTVEKQKGSLNDKIADAQNKSSETQISRSARPLQR